MNPLDDLFREGLGDRKADVPADLWQKIAARKGEVPSGEALDQLFASRLAQRRAPVPAGMWDRIAAARRRSPRGAYAAAAGLLLLLLGSLTYFLGAGPQVPGNDPLAGSVGTATAFPLALPSASDDPSASSAAVDATALSAPPTVGTAGGRTLTAYPSPAPDPARTAGTFLDTRTSDRPAPSEWKQAAPPTATAARQAIAVPPLSGNSEWQLIVPPAALPELSAVAGTPSFRRSGGQRLRGEVLLGAAYAHQRFTLREGEDRSLRDAREVSEFPELSYQISARVQYPLGRRVTLLTGLTYAEIRNQLEYDLPSNGTMTLVRSNNHLRLLEVPVLAGYALSRGRLRLNLNAGPVVNLFSAVRGQYLDPTRATPLDLADSGHYRSNIGLGWTASLTTTYGLGANHATLLLLEPFFKSYPRSFTLPHAPLGEQYWMAGLQLGLRRSF
ncbi:porin family protein [Neolewinella litorea]|uniref:PorT family protein n=1 Tax=Neolewinella litorea TaxID=2562452 RepID=A0A4S4N963_9BACT|nr:PorT family protein [Neolewinella litorea]THH34541.1 PorT family protein [Neolewinella litorea]